MSEPVKHVQAFPITVHSEIVAHGMTLRDYFAAKAIAGAFTDGNTDIDDQIFARRAYQLADAMLAERAK